MELYEEFVRRLRSHLQGVSCGRTPLDPILRDSSCILFHGLAILPPVLTEQERAQMLKYKEEALRLTKQRKKTEWNPRMLRVQTLLESVQVRRAPTLEEFMQNKAAVFVTQSGSCQSARGESSSQIDGSVEDRASLWGVSLPMCSTTKPVDDGKVDDFSFHTFASTSSQPVECNSEVDKQSRIRMTDPPHTHAISDEVITQPDDHKELKSSLHLEPDAQHSVASPWADGQGKEQLNIELKLTGNLSKSVSSPDSIAQTFSVGDAQKSTHSGPQLASGHNKFWSFPRPQLSSSPTRHNKGNSSTKKLLVNTALTLRGHTGRVKCPSVAGQNVVEKILERSMHISQLELSLSSLKSLISDLGTILVQDDKLIEEHHPGDKRPACTSSPGLDQPECCTNSTFMITPGGSSDQPAKEAGSPSLIWSCDMEAPSDLWLQAELDQGSLQCGEAVQGSLKHATNILGSQAKRRLLLEAAEESIQGVEEKPHSSTCKVWTMDPVRQLKQAQAEEEERRAQQLQLQRISLCYQYLQHLSFQRPTFGSHPRDTKAAFLGPPAMLALPFPAVSQTSGLSPHWRHLVAAMVKGYLTRRLLRTERVAQLLRVAKDSQDFLLAFKPSRGVLVSKQDLILLEQVSLQLRSARYEIHDVFFYSTVKERMRIISRDRELIRVRELRRMERPERRSHPKSLERRRSRMVRKER